MILSKSVSKTLLNSKNNSIFNFIAILKDGYINVLGKVLKLAPCHIIVFSNCITGINELRFDRWKIIKILENNEACTGSVNRNGEIEYNEQYYIIKYII